MSRRTRTPEASETDDDTLVGEEGRDFWIEKELSWDEMRGLKFDEYEMVKLARQRWSARQRRERALREAEEARGSAAEETPAEGTPEGGSEGTPAEEGVPEGEPSVEGGEGTPAKEGTGTSGGETLGDKKPYTLGGIEFSFSEISPAPFDDTLKPGEEPEDLAERRKLRDQNVLMAGLLFTEAGDKDGMKKAVEAGNYRFRRYQLKEFYAAVAELPEDVFADKVIALLPALETEEERQNAMATAIRIHDHALVLKARKLAEELESEIRRDYLGEDDRVPRIEVPESEDSASEKPVESGSPETEGETSDDDGTPEEPAEGGAPGPEGESGDGERVAGRRHESDGLEWEGPYGTYRPYRPEVSAPQAERALDNPSIFYRRRKQERRSKGCFATIREVFRGEGEKKTAGERRQSPSRSRTPEKGSTRVRPEGARSAETRVRPGSRPEGGYFDHPVETGGAKRPEGGYFKREEARPAEEEKPAHERKNGRWTYEDFDDIDGADYAI